MSMFSFPLTRNKRERDSSPDAITQAAKGPDYPGNEIPDRPFTVNARGKRLLWTIGLMALALRLLLLPIGHAWDVTVDYNVFIDLANNHSPYDTFVMLSHLVRSAHWDTVYEYYAYPPVPFYIYYPLAKIYHLLHPTAHYFFAVPKTLAVPNLTLDFFFLLKAPIWIADFLIAALMARMSGTARGFRDYLLNPYVLLISGAWTFDAIMVLGLVAGIYAVYRGRLAWAGIALAFGTMVKFFPVIAVPTVVIYLYKKERPLKDFIVFLGAYALACLIFLGPFLQGVLTVVGFHASRPGTGMNWEFILNAGTVFPKIDLTSINDAVSNFGTPALAIVMLLTYWYIWRTNMTLNRMVVVTLLGLFIGSKLLNEQYVLMLIPFAWLEAHRLKGAWRILYRLFWIIPLAFAIVHVPIDRFLFLFYHMVLKDQASVTYLGTTGFELPMFVWKHPYDQEVITSILGFCFFGLLLVAMFWPVRWPTQLQPKQEGLAEPEPSDLPGGEPAPDAGEEIALPGNHLAGSSS